MAQRFRLPLLRFITRRDEIGELRFPIVPELFISRSRVRSLDRND